MKFFCLICVSCCLYRRLAHKKEIDCDLANAYIIDTSLEETAS